MLDLTAVLYSAIDTSRPGLECCRPQTQHRTASRASRRVRRRRAAHAGVLESPHECRKVHQRGRSRLDLREVGRTSRDGLRSRQRHRHRGRPASIGVRHVHAGESFESPRSGRPRHRPDAGAQPGGSARRPSRGAKRWLGRGSEFVVELPVVAASAVGPIESSSPRQFPRRRILIVDDNRDAAETLGELLRALGATVSVAHSGSDALEKLRSFGPDSVLLDIGMPDMDGYEVARRIRATAEYSRILLIALTGWGQEHDQRRSRAAGFDHHVVKPPDIDRLRELLTAGWRDRDSAPRNPRSEGSPAADRDRADRRTANSE